MNNKLICILCALFTNFIPFSFGKWNTSSSVFTIKQRILIHGYKWTPFARIQKRYKNWFGFFVAEG